MPETRELPSVLDEAQRAAAAGDYASAERLLREAAQLQETNLGPVHADLANTLNNLGVVCEITGNVAEAERCYRRAYATATTALDPDHLFVATSRKNLTDFCEAHGIPVESLPPPPPTVPIDIDTDSRVHSDDLPNNPPAPVVAPPVSAGKSSRALVIGALSGIAIVVLALIARPLFKSSGSNESSSSNPAPTAPITPPAAPSRVESPPDASIPAPAPKADARNEGRGADEVKRQVGASSSGGALQVVEAQLCTSLSTGATRSSAGNWQCVRPNGPVTSGSLFFYTRLKSPRDATVEHRWYRGNQLRRAVDRAIRANSTEGYRTFSRIRFGKDSAGEWRVELRDKDGTVLREEKFVVR
jgi:hypothetical protein